MTEEYTYINFKAKFKYNNKTQLEDLIRLTRTLDKVVKILPQGLDIDVEFRRNRLTIYPSNPNDKLTLVSLNKDHQVKIEEATNNHPGSYNRVLIKYGNTRFDILTENPQNWAYE